MTLENLIAALSFLGVGGALGTYFRILWERKNEAQSHKQLFKEERYKCVILLMYASMNFEIHAPLLRQHGRIFSTPEELDDELTTEWHNMILFASPAVLEAMHKFYQFQTDETFRKCAFAMRSDLWGGTLPESFLNFHFNRRD